MIHGLVPALSEAGKIKIGGLGEERKKRDGSGTFRLPQKHDYFTVTTTQRNKAGDLIVDEELMAALPKDEDGRVREIPIILHDDDFEAVFPTTYALYSGKKLACRGDGRTATRYVFRGGQRTGETKEMDCPCDYLNAEKQPTCKPHATLRCSIRVRDRAVAGAVHTWRTTSIISIQRMLGSLMQIRDICGTIVGVPLVLRVQPVQVSPNGVGASTVYCCHVELRASDITAVQRQAIESAQLRAQVRASIGYVPQALPAPGIDEDDDEQAEIAAEFHPEIVDDDPPRRGPIEAPRRASESGKGDEAPAPTETGELATDDQVIHVSSLIEDVDAALGAGAGHKAIEEAIGHPDVDLLTAAQYAPAVEALEIALQAAREAS